MRISWCLQSLAVSTLAGSALGAQEMKFGLRATQPSPLQAVHEWGTYISCQGSDGSTLAGVHHEEQALPDFVHTRADEFDGVGDNGLDWAPVAGTETEVTQKMETPVIYFYSDSPKDVAVTVDVNFPQGVTTHLYPAASSNMPAIGDVAATAGGHTTWDVTVKAEGASLPVPAVDEDNIWAPSRRVDANYVAGRNDEADRLIFYRGVGRFDLDLQASSCSEADVLMVSNTDSDEAIPAVFALETDGYSRGRVVALGSVAAGEKISTPLSDDARSLAGEWLPFAEYETRASVLLEASLRDAGLFPLEARAMVDTWTHSYFRTSGTRVLYVTPRSWVDEVLPIAVDPVPEELERAFVGRVEVLLAGEEEALLQAVQRGASWDTIEARLGRFAEPWIRRLAVLAEAEGDSAAASRCITRANELA
eukprot:INCI19877.1.p1 GENE.INCI19877.1~~INCI19877.1.p1  ORF type:complete len:421 (+),score=77.68 INCI19877.1:125-1387(+)